MQLLPRPQFFSRVSVSVLAPYQSAVIGHLETVPQVYCCETVSGSVDLMLEVRAHDAAELDAVIERSVRSRVLSALSPDRAAGVFRRDLP
ncbi:Lrp/AsnC ligand binding domain-containing protein [Aliamphritea spongicola]|nr:Lrp/AsnC ligand binding domain-containing protein [Aliamphritea spongicola]